MQVNPSSPKRQLMVAKQKDRMLSSGTNFDFSKSFVDVGVLSNCGDDYKYSASPESPSGIALDNKPSWSPRSIRADISNNFGETKHDFSGEFSKFSDLQ